MQLADLVVILGLSSAYLAARLIVNPQRAHLRTGCEMVGFAGGAARLTDAGDACRVLLSFRASGDAPAGSNSQSKWLREIPSCDMHLRSVIVRQRFRPTEVHAIPWPDYVAIEPNFQLLAPVSCIKRGMNAPVVQRLVADFLSELRCCGPVISRLVSTRER